MADKEIIQAAPASAGRRRAVFRFNSSYTRDQKLFIVEAMLINSANVITGGVFLTGLLLMMGASNMMVGLVMSSGSWSLMLSLVSSVIVERVRRKKAMLTGVLLAFRLLTALPVFLPALMGLGMPTAFTAAVMMVAGNVVFSIFNTGFPVFFMNSLPKEGQSSYIYTRMLFLRIAYTILSVVMGLLMDEMHKSYLGFIIVFSTGILIGIADAITLSMIRGKESESEARPAAAGLTRRMFEPFRNKRYLRFLAFTLIFFFFYFTAASYTSLYQVKYLSLSYAVITIYNTCTYILMIFTTRMWASIEDRIGRLKVLVITTVLVSMDLLVYAFLTTGTLWLLPLSVIFSGLGSSGLWACIMPYRYDLMPEEGRTVYEGWFGFIFGAANLLGALMGGQLQKLLPEIASPFMTFSVFQIVYFIAGVLAVLAGVLFWHRAKGDELKT